jgi:hypothetical protein
MHDNYLIFPNAFFVESKFNLFERIDLLEHAIRHWKSLHPLLSANICTDKKSSFGEKYFAYSDSNLSRMDNVAYLKYQLTDATTVPLDLGCQLLFEREFTIGFESETDLLWRLKIVNIDSSLNYWFILTIHHAIRYFFDTQKLIILLIFSKIWYRYNENISIFLQ